MRATSTITCPEAAAQMSTATRAARMTFMISRLLGAFFGIDGDAFANGVVGIEYDHVTDLETGIDLDFRTVIAAESDLLEVNLVIGVDHGDLRSGGLDLEGVGGQQQRVHGVGQR